ncbi:hypothetical protein K3495_g9400 [Podosphaera aphanis]|nr:hypothetical protein K3495_g9400 [Podosphaera aphanis]
MTELRRELARRDDIPSDLNQRTAVAEFQLENHLQNNAPKISTSDNGKAVTKSEPYKFDSKFMAMVNYHILPSSYQGRLSSKL